MGTNFGRLRSILIFFIVTLLILIVIRQVFDFLGRLWLPIVFNFLQIIAAIFACFAALQLRPKFFYIFFIWTPIWIGWNTFLICFYLNIGVLDRSENTVFNFGTKGRSWWHKNVPGCKRTYNATLGIIVVDDCILDYYYVEIIQAGLHILLALIVFSLALLFVQWFQRKCHRTYGSLHHSGRPRPHVTVELTNGDQQQQQCNDGLATDRNGYFNASYDHSPAHKPPLVPASSGRMDNDTTYGINGYLLNGTAGQQQVVQNYRRHSNRRKSTGGSVQRKARDKSRDRLCPPPLPPQPPLTSDGPLNSSKRSRSLQMDNSRSDNANRAESVTRRRSGSADGSSPEDCQHQRSKSDQAVLARRTSGNGGGGYSSRRNSNNSRKSSPKLPSVADLNNFAAPSTVYSYSVEPKRRNNSEQHRAIPVSSPDTSFSDAGNGNIVVYRQKSLSGGGTTAAAAQHQSHQQCPREPPPPPNRHSLFSFDPKSDTLIRYRENLARSQETVLSGISSIDQLLAQNRLLQDPIDIRSYDSGVPPSYNAPSVDTTSRNSQSYGIVPPRPNISNYANHVNLHKRDVRQFDNSKQPPPSGSTGHSLQHYTYDSSYPSANDFPAPKMYDEDESDYLAPNSVLRNSVHSTDYYRLPAKTVSTTNPSADSTIFESTPKDSPSSTPRWSYERDPFVEDGPAVPKINDKGLLV